MNRIDVKGKLCPEPLIIVKRAIKSASVGDSFEVILDNDIASCNLENFLKDLGIEIVVKNDGEISYIYFTIGSSPKDIPSNDSENYCEITPKDNHVIVISSEGMGRDEDGSVALGKMLIRGYLNALIEQDSLPKAIILYNSGVILAAKNIDTVDAFKRLAESGVDILLCGICVDYYNIKEDIKVGRISNMFEITKITSTAGHIVYP